MTNYGPGVYVFCEDPILTASKAQNEGYANYSLPIGVFTLYKNTDPKSGKSLVTKSSGGYDFWETYASSTEDTITFGTSSTNSFIGHFLSNHNYIVFKTILNNGGDT